MPTKYCIPGRVVRPRRRVQLYGMVVRCNLRSDRSLLTSISYSAQFSSIETDILGNTHTHTHTPISLTHSLTLRLAGPVNWRNAAGYLIHVCILYTAHPHTNALDSWESLQYLATVWCLVVLLRYFLFPPSFK